MATPTRRTEVAEVRARREGEGQRSKGSGVPRSGGCGRKAETARPSNDAEAGPTVMVGKEKSWLTLPLMSALPPYSLGVGSMGGMSAVTQLGGYGLWPGQSRVGCRGMRD